MGLISGLLLLPLAPVRGVVWVAEQIQQEAERQWADPGTIQRELAALDLERERGSIDPVLADAREEQLLQRLVQASPEQQQSLVLSEEEDSG